MTNQARRKCPKSARISALISHIYAVMITKILETRLISVYGNILNYHFDSRTDYIQDKNRYFSNDLAVFYFPVPEKAPEISQCLQLSNSILTFE